MLAIVGKATPNENGDIELYLKQFARMLEDNGKFVYAWSFNPKQEAIDYLQRSLARHEDVFLHLSVSGKVSCLRMRITDFYHCRTTGTRCPDKWDMHCIDDLRNISSLTPKKPIHLWFLIETIEDDMPEPVYLSTEHHLTPFRPVFQNQYSTWGQNYFAFLTTK
ncbi:MAG: hypothetical protein NT023_15095 [Armatimonadetes bacterium]|nr:hypothetical protein [Armatimonadota bacterium]